MNSNGGSVPNSYSDHGRSSYNRYRGGPRRGRGRGNNDRSGNQRVANPNMKDRRSLQPWRENNATGRAAVNEESIDLGDSSQWPSVQESSRSGPRGRQSMGQAQERTAEQEINQDYAELHRDVHAANDENTDQMGMRKSTGNYRGYSGNQNMAQNVSHGMRGNYDRQQGNRGRGRFNHYNNSRYQGGYNRRYQKGYAPTVPGNHLFIPDIGPSVVGGPGFDPNQFYPETQTPTYTPTTSTELGPVKQVEYYFSPENLVRDMFIRRKMDKDGWVVLSEIYNFNRIQVLKLSFEDFEQKLMSSELLEVDTEAHKIRTKHEPHKWVIKSDSTPVTGSDASAAFGTSEQRNSFQYIPGGPQMVHSGYPVHHYGYQMPVGPYYTYAPVQPQYRQVQPFQMHPSQFYSFQMDPGYRYLYEQGYFGPFGECMAPNYVGQGQATEQASQSEEGVSQPQAQPTEATEESNAGSSTAEDTKRAGDIEELSQQMSNLDVSNPPVSC